MTAEDMEDQDFIEGVDEDGNKVLLQVVRYFFYNGEEYVVLGDAQQEDECGCHCGECEQSCDEDDGEDDEETVNLYIMKVVPSGDDEETEEFVPVEDEALLEKLIEVVQTDFEKEEALDDEE